MINKEKISTICSFTSGNSINEKIKREKYSISREGLPFIGTKDVSLDGNIDYNNGVNITNDDLDKYNLAQENSTLLCIEGGSAGKKIAFSPKPCFTGNKLLSIKSKIKELDNKYLYYFILSKHFKEKFNDQLKGLIGGVGKNKIKNFEIFYPEKKIQEKVVSKLDKISENIDKIFNKIKKNKKNINSFLSKSIDEIFSKINTKVNEDKLINLCEKKRIITYGIIKLGKEDPNGIYCLRTSNVKPLFVNTDIVKKVSKQISENYSRTILQGNEVLINIRGTLGGVSSVTSEMIGWNVSREIAVIPIDINKISQQFLVYYLISEVSKKFLKKNVKGTAYKGINLTDLRNLPVKYPDLDQQKVIIKKIKDIEIQIKKLNNNLINEFENLISLRSSIINKYLS